MYQHTNTYTNHLSDIFSVWIYNIYNLYDMYIHNIIYKRKYETAVPLKYIQKIVTCLAACNCFSSVSFCRCLLFASASKAACLSASSAAAARSWRDAAPSELCQLAQSSEMTKRKKGRIAFVSLSFGNRFGFVIKTAWSLTFFLSLCVIYMYNHNFLCRYPWDCINIFAVQIFIR